MEHSIMDSSLDYSRAPQPMSRRLGSRVSPLALRRIASTIATLALAVLMLVAALAASIDALERATGAPALVTARTSGAEVMIRPTLHLEARSMAMFGPSASQCS